MQLRAICCLILSLALFACKPPKEIKPPPPAGAYVFGSEYNEVGFDIMELDDGFLLTGGKQNPETGLYDLWLIKVDQNGDEIWTKLFEKDNKDQVGVRLVKGSNGYAVLTKTKESQNYYSTGYSILLLDESFLKISESPIAIANSYSENNLLGFEVLSNGKYLLVHTDNYETSVKVLDEFAVIESVSTVANNQYASFNSQNLYFAGDDGNYYIWVQNENGQYSGYIYQIDANGQPTNFSALISFTESFQATAFAQSKNGGFLLRYKNYSSNESRLLLMDSIGNSLQEIDLPSSNDYSNIFESDSGYLFMGKNISGPGYYSYEAEGSVSIEILEIDSSGNSQNKWVIGGSKQDQLRKVIRCSDGRYAMIGHTQSYGAGGIDLFLSFFQP